MTKPTATGLKGFGSQPLAETPPNASSAIQAAAAQPARQRSPKGRKEFVSLTVRIKHKDWLRLHQIAAEESTSLQKLCELGLSRVLADLGLPPLT